MIEDYEIESFEYEQKKLDIQYRKGILLFIGALGFVVLRVFSLVTHN